MAKTSSARAEHVMDLGAVEDRSTDLDGYTINFVTFKVDLDHAPLFKGLPGDHCNCPHWGYVFKGRIVVTFEDHQEVIEGGDAFYLPPGHTPAADADTELVMFSPADELAATDAAIEGGLAAAQSPG